MILTPAVENGFLFQCKRCGKCCSSSTEGFVFVFPKDIENLARYFGCSKEELARKYLRMVNYNFHFWDAALEDTGNRIALPTLVLDSKNVDDCIFLTQNGSERVCKAYHFRPCQCRLYPCWSMFCIRTDEAFHELAEECQGFHIDDTIATQFPIEKMSREKILNSVQEERQVERDYMVLLHQNGNDIYKVYPFLRPAGSEAKDFPKIDPGLLETKEEK